MRLSADQRVSYAEARRRALVTLSHRKPLDLVPAWLVAAAIWPNHRLRAQGAGGAASRILRRMQDEGLVRWTTFQARTGWTLTSTGRLRAAKERA